MPNAIITDPDQLSEVFRAAEKPREAFRIGMEAEKFGVYHASRGPLDYLGGQGVEGIFKFLIERFGYTPYTETETGPVVALHRGTASITLEPAAQVELSGEPHVDLHLVRREFDAHLAELCEVSQAFGVRFLHIGFHPIAKPSELPWVPKRRYPVMAEYLPSQGARGLDMMQRTATVQANLDYSSEADAMRKLRVLLRLSPMIGAFTMNAPFIEGRQSPLRSERQDVWQHMDPRRSGTLPQLWEKPELRYSDYIEWALDAGMFLFYRGERLYRNTGQTFRAFLRDGFEGERATLEDWKLHLGTLFPEVRLKTTLELRCCDCLPPDLAVSIPALALGLTADDRALDAAEAVAQQLRPVDAPRVIADAQRDGLAAQIGGQRLGTIAERVLDAARGGLQRRARLNAAGQDESCYLTALTTLIDQGLTPADALLGRYRASNVSVTEFVTQYCCVRKDA
jgi:glutamate--cysteine ligase